MGLRTIEAPGVEIKEIDKSGYTPVMTGSKCYVMGYSSKGTPYTPMIFTSKAAWQSFYGEPTNEAEKYFYNACSEVINQNGVLNCARIPYENNAKDKMVGYKFKVSMTPKNIPSAGEYIQLPTVKPTLFHDKDYECDALDYAFDNLLNREINGKFDSLELDTELRTFYKSVIDCFDAKYKGKKDRYSVEWYDCTELSAKSQKELSARFLTYKEAEEYVNGFNGAGKAGVYDYYTVLSDCIKYDQGDWLAQPLCCTYKKVSVWNDAPKTPEPQTIQDMKDRTLSLMISYPSEKYVEMNIVGDIAYNVDILDTIVPTDSPDRDKLKGIVAWLVNVQNVDDTTKEMRKYSAQRYIDTKLSDEFFMFPMSVYCEFGGVTIEDMKYKFPVAMNKTVVNDGYDNEPMYYETISSLYYDILSAQMQQLPSVTKLFAGDKPEIWQPAVSCSLGRLINDRLMSFEEFKDKWNKDFLKAPTTDKLNGYLSSWDAMLTYFANNANITFKDVIEKYGPTKYAVHAAVPYYPITDGDKTANDYLEITQSEYPIECDLTAVDEYFAGESNVPANTFWIFDKTCDELKDVVEDERKGKDRQLLGIFPIVTTAANALYAQSMIDVDTEFVTDFETATGTLTKLKDKEDTGSSLPLLSTDIVTQFSNDTRTKDQIDRGEVLDTISRTANEYFSAIQMTPGKEGMVFDSENMKKIGVVVVKAYLDASEGNKISFNVLESFVGHLDKDAVNPNTKVSTFIDKIVNTNSDYIYFFSNCFVNSTQKKIYDNVDLFIKTPGKTGMLGFFRDQTKRTMTLPSIYSGIDKCFMKIEDINERDIDIVCDAGLANIAQYMKSVYGGLTPQEYNLKATDDNGNSLLNLWTCKKESDVNAWKTVQFKYDNFCKNVRKDCMFIADGPRPLVLQGEKKIIRNSKPSNTIDANILPNIKYITGLNTNYGAGYCDWFQITDEFTGDEMWLPPSIKAMGVYINTDLNFNYWDAPAGLNRGVIQALDVAFSPTVKQAGQIYTKNWNYAINYPYDGIVLEGQKTFQVKPSAFDRVNVRRLFLRLERQTYKVARYFVYEGNTAYTRQRLIDMLDPLFYTAKVGGGIYDYRIICDESNNTANVIDNNELRVKIGIKPVKTAEFILIDFIALSTGGSFTEM